MKIVFHLLVVLLHRSATMAISIMLRLQTFLP
jgi:hypothetical protein